MVSVRFFFWGTKRERETRRGMCDQRCRGSNRRFSFCRRGTSSSRFCRECLGCTYPAFYRGGGKRLEENNAEGRRAASGHFPRSRRGLEAWQHRRGCRQSRRAGGELVSSSHRRLGCRRVLLRGTRRQSPVCLLRSCSALLGGRRRCAVGTPEVRSRVSFREAESTTQGKWDVCAALRVRRTGSPWTRP